MASLQLHVCLFGSLTISCHEQPLPNPPTLKSQSLLAYLIFHREKNHFREQLADLFWGGRPERKARRSLNTAVWHIRRSFSDESCLLSNSLTIQFDPQVPVWLDVQAFENLASENDLTNLEAAVALYRGDFLDGFYDDWIINERYRLETLFGETLARLMARQEGEGAYEAALSTSLQLLDLDSLREDAHCTAMRAHCQLGNRNAALKQYQTCRDILHDELGAEPLAETSALYQDILVGHLEIGTTFPAPTTKIVAAGHHLGTGRSPFDVAVRSPFVGREQELAFLHKGWQDALCGRNSLLLIGGDAGVGKTRLVEEFADHLRWQGVTIIHGRCYEFERLLPFQPIAEALQTIPVSLKTAVLANIPPWVVNELDRLAPTNPADKKRVDNPTANQPDDDRSRLFESLAIFFTQLSSQGPLLIILEDLHWASESTLQLLHYLARKLLQNRAMVIGTYRQETLGPHHPLATIQRRLSREGLAFPLHLLPLSQAAVLALLGKMSGAGEDVRPLAVRLHRESEGNPFFLMELCKMLFDTGAIQLEEGVWQADFTAISREPFPLPAGVNEAIMSRIHRLGESRQETIRAAAVLGREFDFELLNTVLGHEENETLVDIDELLRQQLLIDSEKVTARDYVFAHHKIQEAIYEALPRRHRQRLHAQAGAAMETVYGSNSHEYLAELAFHYEQGRQWDQSLSDKAVHYLLRAGDAARLIYAHEDAAHLYKQALVVLKQQGAIERTARTQMKLGLTFLSAANYQRSREAYNEGFRLWQQIGQSVHLRPEMPAPHPLRFDWYAGFKVPLDPCIMAGSLAAALFSQLYIGLVALDAELNVVPELALDWQVTQDGQHYRFYLRDDIYWSDGTPVTAADFEFGWKRLLHPANRFVYADNLFDVKGARAYNQGETANPGQVAVTASDDQTLVVELEQPCAYFLHKLTLQEALPAPRHLLKSFESPWPEGSACITNGPFLINKWQPGHLVRFSRNPHYRGPVKGNVELVEIFPDHDLKAMLDRFATGLTDMVYLFQPTREDTERVRTQFATHYLTSPRLETWFVSFGPPVKPFSDWRVRQALILTTDRERLASKTLLGTVAPADGGVIPPGMPGHTPNIGPSFDPELARQLLAEAGFPGGRGFPNLTFYTFLRSNRKELLNDWQQILGIEMKEIVLHDFQNQVRDLRQGDTPCLIDGGWIADCPDPQYVLDTGMAMNAQHLGSDYDVIISQARHETDQLHRLALYQQADRMLIEQSAIIPLFYGRNHLLIQPWVTRYPISPLNWQFWKDVVIEPH